MSTKQKRYFSYFLVALAIPGCGKVSDLLDKDRTKNKSSEISETGVHIQYQPITPDVFGERWRRRINVKRDGKVTPNVIVEFRRQGQTQFQPMGLTDERGSLMDKDATEHTQYRIGENVVSEWQSGLRDLHWTASTTPDELRTKFAALKLDGVIETNLSQKEIEPVTLKVERLVIERGATVSWNQIAPLTIQASLVQIDGTLRAFAENCASGASAPDLHLTAKRILGAGRVEWSGCTGTTGEPGARGASGKDGEAAPGKQNGLAGGPGETGRVGGTGGNGAKVTVESGILEMYPYQLITEGGPGGLGGPGGEGGTGGAGARYTFHRGGKFEYDREVVGRSGNPGATGEAGPAGEVGKAGQVILKTDNQLYQLDQN